VWPTYITTDSFSSSLTYLPHSICQHAKLNLKTVNDYSLFRCAITVDFDLTGG